MTNILVVDDEKSILRFIDRLLRMRGFNGTTATCAVEAREAMKSMDFELILCDVNMPGESGIDFIRYALREYPQTAVVMLTGVDDPDIAETALDLGAYGYIIKPFKPNELVINIDNALRRRKLEMNSRIQQQGQM